jgi:hypothetical protein
MHWRPGTSKHAGGPGRLRPLGSIEAGFNLAATTRPHAVPASLRLLDPIASRFYLAATTRPHAVPAGLRLLDPIVSMFNLAATTRRWRGWGLPSSSLSVRIRVWAGSDNKAGAALWPASGCPACAVRGSGGQRWEVVGGGWFLGLGMARGPIPLGDQAALLGVAALPPAVARWGSLRPVPAPALASLARVSRTSLGIVPSPLASL